LTNGKKKIKKTEETIQTYQFEKPKPPLKIFSSTNKPSINTEPVFALALVFAFQRSA